MKNYVELLKKPVEDINAYLADVCVGNNESARIHNATASKNGQMSMGWMQIRMAAIVEIPKYVKSPNGQCYDEDDIPKSTTHMIVVGIQHWYSLDKQNNTTNCFSGIITPAIKHEDTLSIGDINEMLDPKLYDATMNECIEWMRGLGVEDIEIYHDLYAEDGTELPLPDSEYSK